MCGGLIPNIDRVVMQEMEGRLREVYRARTWSGCTQRLAAARKPRKRKRGRPSGVAWRQRCNRRARCRGAASWAGEGRGAEDRVRTVERGQGPQREQRHKGGKGLAAVVAAVAMSVAVAMAAVAIAP